MRNDVADLMAIAPALPVQDLYNLLIELKGNLPAARQQAIRASQKPSPYLSIKPERPAVTVPSHNTALSAHDLDGDEVMIKIDPNETFLEYVSLSTNSARSYNNG